jgi:Heparinase II/III-like protein/Heparinase II/III N-terminus
VVAIVRKLRGRSLAELRLRARQALSARLERLQAGSRPRAAEAGEPAAPDFCAERWFSAARLASGGAHGIAAAVARGDPQCLEALRALSDDLLHGTLSLLGHAPLALGNPPNWHREPLSGCQAPLKHWSLINHMDTRVMGDHKLLWELNRHQYLLAAALCWALDREPRRFALIEAHLQSWLEANPRGIGANWISSLELAYRAISWFWLLWLLQDAPWQAPLRAALLRSLAAHAAHIERYLSTYSSPNTHLTGEALGLFYAGTLLSDTRAPRWRAKGASILESELTRQVLPDGVYFEQASQYQRYTAEIYLHYLLLGTSSGWPVSPQVGVALGRMCEVLRSLCDAGGCMPLIGDDDGGLLLPLDHRPPQDLRAVLLAAALTLGRAELAPAGAPPAFAYWLCGIGPTDNALAQPPRVPPWCERHYPQGGIAVLRDGWQGKDALAVIDAGPHGGLSCGHSHADALAMTLTLGSTPLLIDRGTFTYSGPERNEFRATLSHNTLELDAESSVTPGEPFRWRDVPPRATARVFTSAHFSALVGLAHGHAASPRPSSHRRVVLHQRGGAWLVRDSAVRRDARGACVRWQLAPQLRAQQEGTHLVRVHAAGGAILASLWAPQALELRVLSRPVSLRLGHRQEAECLELLLSQSLECVSLIVPGVARIEPAAQLAAASSGCLVWSDAAGRHRVFLGPEGADSAAMRLLGFTELSWWVARGDSAAGNGFTPDLVAAFAAGGPTDVDPFTAADPASGTMSVLEMSASGWAGMPVDVVGGGG